MTDSHGGAAGVVRDVKAKPISAFPSLLDIGMTKFATMSARAEMLTALKDMGYIPQDVSTSRAAFRREKAQVASSVTPYGPLIVQRDFVTKDGLRKFPLQNPCALLDVALGQSEKFAQYFREAVDLHGLPSANKPWDIVMYMDEITCGNPLALGSKRKVQAIYWTIYQLGPQAMADETVWLEILAIRSKVVCTFAGGMSHCVERALDLLFDAAGNDLRTGLMFNVLGYGKVTLTARLGMLTGDFNALVEVIGGNGVSALLPCPCCERVLSWQGKNKRELIDDDRFVTLSCLDHARCGKRSGQNITRLLKRLDQPPPGALKKLQTLTGYKKLDRNFVLRGPVKVDLEQILFFDFMHLEFQTGNWNREFWNCLKLAKACGFPNYQACGDYCKRWQYPVCPNFKILFTREHFRSCNEEGSQYFKCQASCALSLYPIACKFMTDIVLPQARQCEDQKMEVAILSLRKHCYALDLLTASKQGKRVPAHTLQAAFNDWGQSLTEAWGDDLWFPKTHISYTHLADQLAIREQKCGRHAFVPACWAQEMHAQ